MKRFVIAAGGLLAMTSVATAQVTIQPEGEGNISARIAPVDLLVSVWSEDDTFTTDIRVNIGEDIVYEKRTEEIFSSSMLPLVQLVEMDNKNDTTEVLIQQYTGGAHCCNAMTILSKSKDGTWDEIDVGAFDGGPGVDIARDMDGDGQAEIEIYDNRFLYQFSSYADSRAPLQIFGFRDGALVDVSTDDAFEINVRGHLESLGEIPESGEARNSWLATYAATLLQLDEDDPLDYAISAHDDSVTWGMMRCKVEEVDFRCPDGQEENIGFEAALTEFLTETGYLEAQ